MPVTVVATVASFSVLSDALPAPSPRSRFRCWVSSLPSAPAVPTIATPTTTAPIIRDDYCSGRTAIRTASYSMGIQHCQQLAALPQCLLRLRPRTPANRARYHRKHVRVDERSLCFRTPRAVRRRRLRHPAYSATPSPTFDDARLPYSTTPLHRTLAPVTPPSTHVGACLAWRPLSIWSSLTPLTAKIGDDASTTTIQPHVASSVSITTLHKAFLGAGDVVLFARFSHA